MPVPSFVPRGVPLDRDPRPATTGHPRGDTARVSSTRTAGAAPRASSLAYAPLAVAVTCLLLSVWLDTTTTAAERTAADIGFAFPVALPSLAMAAASTWVLREHPG